MNFTRKPCLDSGYLLWQISNIWQKRINNLLSEHGITHVQYLLLATIHWMHDQKLAVNQNSLALQAKSHKMMTSKVLRSLERQGYIMRFEDPKDTRSKLITLTEFGEEKFMEVKELFEKADKKFFNTIERNRFSLNRIFVDMIEENQVRVSF